jgi:sodium transport system permease protein
MSHNVITIAKKELRRFFSNKVSAAVAILLPGLLIFAMWSFMGSIISDSVTADDEAVTVVAGINIPESVRSLAESSDIEILDENRVPSSDDIRASISEGTYLVFALFPQGFDASVADYNTKSGVPAPQIEIFYDSTDPNSSAAYNDLISLLDSYESQLANRFDINAGEISYDVSDEKNRAAIFMASIVPMLLLILLFTGCMSIAAEAIAGEKERGTMAALLATPIKRSSIALGKILALSLIGLAIATSSVIGIFASLPSISQGSINLNVYGLGEYALLALVVISTTLVIVMMIAVVSTLAKTTK